MRANLNQLRAAIESGQVTEDDLRGMVLSGAIGGSRNALAAAGQPVPEPEMDFVRNETTGTTTYLPRPAERAVPRYRVVGVGSGGQYDLGDGEGALPPVDVSRGTIEIPGVGKGQYSRDGRYAIVDDGQGGKVKVVLGYDRAGSMRATAQDLALQKARADLEYAQENTGLLREKRAMLAAANAPVTDAGPQVISQKQLEEAYGKPDKGYRWRQDGQLEPLPGGEVQRDAQGTVDKAADALSQVEGLIGKRGADGKLAPNAKAHPGFGQSVGIGFPGLKYIPGSDEADFNRRLDQLKGGAFLQAFESLKGGGQITEVEGRKATDAITRMSTSQSEDEFVRAALEFQGIVQRGLERAKSRGGMPAMGAQPRPMPGAAPSGNRIRQYNPATGRIE